jgi:very-short-patch-repair endonuclease
MPRRKKKTKTSHAKRGMRGKSSDAKHAFAKKMRNNLTAGEKTLWSMLSSKQLGVWVYSQQIVYGYIPDFWCPKVGLVIEVDGPSHLKQKAYDRKRDAALKKKGIITMRFTNEQVEKNTAACVALIRDKIRRRIR